jgi:diaminohydroxyphosphoribosylaminopyrimidine deaminase/5-amino-6-(5-phosphoribosylamino)uracil reductase
VLAHQLLARARPRRLPTTPGLTPEEAVGSAVSDNPPNPTSPPPAMERAISLAEAARRETPPNPWVGCVLVDPDGVVVGEGATAAPGGPHAEIAALRAAGIRARGTTAYVTLEPCCHTGRTGPCADALIAAGVQRVVAALEDPDPLVAGAGFARLRGAGIDVETGVGAAAATQTLRAYLHHRSTGRPWCVLKTAMSLDGRTAAADGSSRWITGPMARADGHRLRADSQAVLVGSGTALADAPSLTARDVDPPVVRQPLRVLVDGRGRVPAAGPLFDIDLAPTLVLTTERSPDARRDDWQAAGAKVEVLGAAPAGGVDLRAALELLGREGVLQVLVEGGATVHGSLLDAGLADEIVAYVAPVVLGPDAHPAFETGTRALAGAPSGRVVSVDEIGGDVRIVVEPERG